MATVRLLVERLTRIEPSVPKRLTYFMKGWIDRDTMKHPSPLSELTRTRSSSAKEVGTRPVFWATA